MHPGTLTKASSAHAYRYAVPWQDEECEPLGQAIAEVEGGSPRRGRSPTRSSPFGDSPRLHRRDHGRPDAGSPERRLRQRSLELQEADTRDAKGRVRCCRDGVQFSQPISRMHVCLRQPGRTSGV